MTIEKLAKFIVEDYYNGTTGDEKYQILVEHEIKKMKIHLTSIMFDIDSKNDKIVIVPIYRGE